MNQSQSTKVHEWTPPDTTDILWTVVRIACLFILFGLLIFGCYYAIQVFLQIGRLVQNPAIAKEAVGTVADMIEAEQLVVPIGKEQEPIKIGKLIALLVVVFGYFLWSWIPLKIVGIAGSSLLKTYLPAQRRIPNRPESPPVRKS